MINFFKRLLGRPRHFTQEETEELRNLYLIVNGEQFKLDLLKANTALAPKMKRNIVEMEEMLDLLKNKRADVVAK